MSESDRGADRRVAIYASASGPSTVAVMDQLDAARNHAQEAGLEVVSEYIDLGGSDGQLYQMMTDASADDPRFRRVLVFSLSRISRRAEKLNLFGSQLKACGVEITSVSEPEWGAVAKVFGDYLSCRHSEQVRRGMREAARRGFYVFSQAPYGYRKVQVWDSGFRRFKLEPGPPASETVRRIFDLRLLGTTESEIAAVLNANGVNPPAVGRWGVGHVRRILGNEVYCGTSVAARQDMENPETAVRATNAFPAIVTQEEFDLVQRMQ